MTVKVELGFTEDGQGAPFFRLDDPVLGRLDDPNVFLGGGEVFVDVTEFFEAYSITRGKSRELDRHQAGQASVQFENTLRTFDPTFEASPYFGQIVPKRKIRITNGDIIQFEGSIEDWNIEYAPGGKSIAIAQAFDAFAFLSGLNFSGTFTEEKTDNRVNAVLDEIGWSATRRQIQNTGADLAAQTVEDAGALEYLQTTARSEPGDFFAAKNNDLKLVGRNTPFTSGGVIFSDDGSNIPYKTIGAIFGSELLFNEITISSSAGTAVATNETSKNQYGERDLTEATFLSSTGQLQQLADYLTTKYAEPEFRFESITADLKVIEGQQRTDLLDLELGDIVKVEFTPNDIAPAIERFGKIIGMQQQVSNDREEIIIRLETTAGALLVLDDAEFGRLDSNNLLGW
jgi:translation initiation factor IF-1